MNRIWIACSLSVAGVFLCSCTASEESQPAIIESSAPTSAPTLATSHRTSPPTDELPGFVDCVGEPVTRPTELSLRCIDDSRMLVDIEWEKWGRDGAIGKGQLVESVDGGPESKREATVELSAPFETPQGFAFTRISVNGGPEQP